MVVPTEGDQPRSVARIVIPNQAVGGTLSDGLTNLRSSQSVPKPEFKFDFLDDSNLADPLGHAGSVGAASSATREQQSAPPSCRERGACSVAGWVRLP